MQQNNFKADIMLKNQKFKFEGVSVHNPMRPIDFDYVQPIGDGDGFRGLEMLLLTFGGCVSTAIVFLLRKQDKHIESFKLKLEGVKQDSPLKISQILFDAEIISDNISEEDMETILKQTEMVSPVWNMIKGNTEIVSSFTLINKHANS